MALIDRERIIDELSEEASWFNIHLEENKELVNVVLENGEEVAYVYDYAYSNNSSIKYPTSGEIYNYPLVSLLSKKGVNRHLVDYSNYLTSSDLFLEGDSFATDSQIEGFYRNFAFHNEEKLGISFNVDKIENNTATITFRRVK